jgi:integrase
MLGRINFFATPYKDVAYPSEEVTTMLLDTFLDTVYVPLKLRGRSPESVRLLRHAIRQFSLFLGRPATLDDFDDLTVSRFLAARSVKLSPNSVARERSGLLALWNLAQARALVRLRPLVAPELIPDRTPRAFTADELGRLWESCGQVRGYVGPVVAGIWFKALLGVLFYSGERITAVLRVGRDRWQRPWLSIPAEARKGSRKPATYQLPDDVADLVDQVAAHDQQQLFFWPACDTALRTRWKRITKRAGLGDGPEVQFHALRRSFASHLDAGGGNAREALQHSSEKVTRRYLDPRITQAGRPAPWQLLPRIWPRPANGPSDAGAA